MVEGIFAKSRNILKSYMKNLNMLFNNILPTYLYSTFQIIKLLIRKGNPNLIHNQNYISTLYIKFHQVNHCIHLNIPIYKKEDKLIYDFILYTQETCYMKMESKYCIMGSINQDKNKNETYSIHFIFHTNILHIKSSRIPVMENNVNITSQVMGRQ